jgi:hypothetical protein
MAPSINYTRLDADLRLYAISKTTAVNTVEWETLPVWPQARSAQAQSTAEGEVEGEAKR